MSEIIPAILPENFEDLRSKIEILEGVVPLIHIDVTDGTLTPDSTWPYKEEDDADVSSLSSFEDIHFDVHLMVEDPLKVAEDWIRAGAHALIIHAESFSTKDELKGALKALQGRFDRSISYIAPEVGLAINLDTPLGEAREFFPEVDFVHLMSIKEIGKQGNPFSPEIFERIHELKEEFPDMIISVDGGVNQENARELAFAGADSLVVGSAIFKAEDPAEAIDMLREELE